MTIVVNLQGNFRKMFEIKVICTKKFIETIYEELENFQTKEFIKCKLYTPFKYVIGYVTSKTIT